MDGEDVQQPPPGLLGLGVGPDQGIVEVEQDGARQRNRLTGSGG
jgi:hypothetical protein